MAKKKQLTKRRTRAKPEGIPHSETNGHVVDGKITFEVQGGPYSGESIEMDPMLVKLAAERLERRHKLEVIDGRMEATAEFARDLTASLEGLGYHATPSIAIKAWITVCEYFVALQKKTN